MRSVLAVNLTLLLIAAIWGFGFVPQREGMNSLGPSAFNALRFALGALTLLPVMLWSKQVSFDHVFNMQTLRLGLIVGLILFGGASMQQLAIKYTSLANVAFISGLYVIMVPMIGFFIGYRYAAIVWLGGVVAIVGLYLMTGSNGEISLQGDILALLGAVFWAIHLLVLALYAGRHNQLSLAFIQFLVCAIFSLVTAVILEGQLLPGNSADYFWILLNGIVVVGLGYTLQVVVMQYAEPFTASLILSLEGVFGAVAGYFVYQEQLGAAALVGAAMMMLGCLLAQLPGTQSTVEQRLSN
ncbi:MAG: DMT family transporter [Gammaproteobacteria bacterium]|nr:DMT family transporter [Gammaproteobacteria bacterium]